MVLFLSVLGIALRWLHLAVSVGLVGFAGALVLAGRSDRPTALAWEARVVAGTRALALLALVTGAAVLAYHTATLEGRAAAALEPAAWLRVLTGTQAGHVWLARIGLLALLAAFVSVRWDVARSADWTAARVENVVLGAGALVLLAGAGHAAAVEPGTATAMLVDAGHLCAAGLWIGGLPAVALLVRAAAGESGADARPYAVVAARRFSRAALVLIVAAVATGVAIAAVQVGDVAGLVGTAYGRLLLGKIVLVAAIVGVAAWNRRRVLPRLGGEAVREGRPALRRLAAGVTGEALLAVALLGVVAAMGTTPPARHEQPLWPFAFRLSTVGLETSPALPRVLVGSQLAVLGLVGALAAWVWRGRRAPLVAGAVVLAGFGVGLALPPLAIDAYPTTYVRPAVPYSATSIERGLARYRERCAACHGPRGAGDGPAARTLPKPPADLRAPHTGQHTAGDLFWWITAGIPAAGMPPAGGDLTEDERWDLVNVVRLFAAADAARVLGPGVEPDRPWLVAPDFAFSVGPTPARTLREYRGRRHVLVVLYQLPQSRARLAQLAEAYQRLTVAGAEVIAVPRDGAPDAVRRLAGGPLVLFPVVTDGARAIVETYGLLAREAHAEFLVDRQGYVRARVAGPTPPASVEPLLSELATLGLEKTTVPPPDEHVH